MILRTRANKYKIKTRTYLRLKSNYKKSFARLNC